MENGKPRCLVEELVELVPLVGSAATIAARGLSCRDCLSQLLSQPRLKSENPHLIDAASSARTFMCVKLLWCHGFWKGCAASTGIRLTKAWINWEASRHPSISFNIINHPSARWWQSIFQLRLRTKLVRMASKPSPVSQASWRLEVTQDELQ